MEYKTVKELRQMLKAKGYPRLKVRKEGGLSSKVPKPPEGRRLL